MALRLKRRGISRVRPLQGGYDAWVAQGLPLETLASAEPPAAPVPVGAGG